MLGHRQHVIHLDIFTHTHIFIFVDIEVFIHFLFDYCMHLYKLIPTAKNY